jgi:hypothetical protein
MIFGVYRGGAVALFLAVREVAVECGEELRQRVRTGGWHNQLADGL